MERKIVQSKQSKKNLFLESPLSDVCCLKSAFSDYMHFRYYASTMGRFLKPDSIIPNAANPQSWNLYSYVNCNPVNFNDLSGHLLSGFGGGITNISTRKTLLGGPFVEMPLAFEYGGDWTSKEILEFFGVKPIYITLNAVIDQTMTAEEQEQAKTEFKEQLENANKVYNRIGIYLGAEYQPGNVPRPDPNSTPEEFRSKCFSMSPPGRVTVFISNFYSGAAADVNTKTRTGFVLLGVLNRRSSTWDLTHELGHVFGFRFGPRGDLANAPNDVAINTFIRYMRGMLPFLEPFPATMLSASLWLRYNANMWGE
jgi:RHS repeat-associated protein